MGVLTAWFTNSRLALAIGKWAAIAFTITLFLLSLRRSSQRAGRLAERFENTEKVNEIQRQMLKAARAALLIVTSLLSACATVSSERVVGVCPPVVAYNAGVQAQVAEEVQALPEGSEIVEMLSGYAVMREQGRGRACDVH